jgi:hypothetical protein
MENVRVISPVLKELLPAKVYQELIMLPENGQAEIRLVNPKRVGTIVVRDYTDAEGIYRQFYDEHGNPKTTRYNKKKVLNFSKINDCLEYLQVKDHPIYSKSNTPVFIPVNVHAQAIEDVEKMDLEGKVRGIISELKGQKLFLFARLLGIPVNHASSEAIIKKLVYDAVRKDPAKVLEEYESPDKVYKEVFFQAKESKIIREAQGLWFFNNERIGINQDQAINWLKLNSDLIPSINTQLGINNTQGNVKVPMAVAQPPVVPSIENAEQEKERLEYVKLAEEAVTEGNLPMAIEMYELSLKIKSVPAFYKRVKEMKLKLESDKKELAKTEA